MKDLMETEAQGFKVENGKLVYFSNMLDGYRHEFKGLQEICEEINGMMKKNDSYMAQIEFWKVEAQTYKLWKDKLVEELKQSSKETAEEIFKELYTEANSNISEIVELTTFQIKQLAKQYGVEIGEEKCLRQKDIH